MPPHLRLRLPLTLTALLLGSTLQAAPLQSSAEDGTVQVEVVADKLEHPWGVAVLPQGQGWLVTERPGRLRYIAANGTLSAPLTGTPAVHDQGQGGLLDVVLSPTFAEDRQVYLTYAESDAEGAATAVGHGRLADDMSGLEDFTVIFRQAPRTGKGHHFGSRLAFAPDGNLFVVLGEHNLRTPAQDLNSLLGKVVRIAPDGSIPADNPWAGKEGARPEIWSYGHRNPQGATVHPRTGTFWMNEHGPRGGDEINLPQAGANYGWPLATHGVGYSGAPVPEARGVTAPGTEEPHYVWQQSPAVSGMAFLTSEAAPEAWRDNLFIGALKTRELIRLTLDADGSTILHEERLLGDLKERIRDVRDGGDGSLYVLTDAANGALWRVTLTPTAPATPGR